MSDPRQADGVRDFDFVFGTWRSENRRLADARDQTSEWLSFESALEARPILGGLGNTDNFVTHDFPGRGWFEGITLRLFDPDRRLWRIWWASTSRPGPECLDPPVVGRFEDAVGRFECDDELDGQPIKVRYEWKDITPSSAAWEQAFSFDGGESW